MNINKELSIKNTETGLNETPLSKLIPWNIITADNNLYFDWNKIFALEPKQKDQEVREAE
jgi:hypothetical protein